MSLGKIDHFYKYGDVYDAMDACDSLDLVLSRLKRQQVLNDREWEEMKDKTAAIRRGIERHIEAAALTPRGPSLP